MKPVHLLSMLFAILCNSKKLLAQDLFTSLQEMNKLVDTGDKISIHLKAILDGQIKNLRKASTILDGFEEIKRHSKLHPEQFTGNPINSFLLIKSLSNDLQKFIDVMNNEDRLIDLVHHIQENFVLPTDDDYRGAIDAIHRLEDTYLLEPKDIRIGNLSKVFPSRPLTSFECFEIGRIAYDKEDFYHTVIWMTEALEQNKLEGDNPTADHVLILDYLAFATSQQKNFEHAIELTKDILKIAPDHPKAAANLVIYKNNLQIKQEYYNKNNSVSETATKDFFNKRQEIPERDSYEYLCRTEDPKVADSKLKCRYINYNPILTIAPAKEEQIHRNPDIWIYHDVISDKQINLLKELATPRLKRAIVRNYRTGISETVKYRISKSSWIEEEEDEALPYLTKLIESITKLNLETAEEWQVANYGIAGQYDPHVDFARKSDNGQFDESVGNRVATWMFYLEAPEKGGATVFPDIGERIKPTRGSAVFWYNLLPSGDGDMRTRHAACPVLYGSKWVANKWIHSRGQEFNRPCNLIKEETEDI